MVDPRIERSGQPALPVPYRQPSRRRPADRALPDASWPREDQIASRHCRRTSEQECLGDPSAKRTTDQLVHRPQSALSYFHPT